MGVLAQQRGGHDLLVDFEDQAARERLDGRVPASAMGHYATPARLLHMARVAYGAEPEAWLIRMGCNQFEIGEGLSAEAERAVSRAVEEVLSCI